MPPASEFSLTFRSGGKDIRLDCFLPAAVKRCPAVIALHGSGGNYAGMSEPARSLAAEGVAVFVLHYFDRTGTIRVENRSTILRNSPLWLKTLWDCVTFVAEQKQIDPSRIGLIGFSLGAYLSITAAAMDSRIKAVVDFFGGLPREVKPFVRRLCPILILHGDADSTVPVTEAYNLQRLLEERKIPYEIKIYDGAAHGFTGNTWHDATKRSLAFLKKHLLT